MSLTLIFILAYFPAVFWCSEPIFFMLFDCLSVSWCALSTVLYTCINLLPFVFYGFLNIRFNRNTLSSVRMHSYTRVSHYQYSCNVNTPSGLLFPPLLCSLSNDQTRQMEGSAALTVTLPSQRGRKNGSPNTLPLLNLPVPVLAKEMKGDDREVGQQPESEKWVNKVAWSR